MMRRTGRAAPGLMLQLLLLPAIACAQWLAFDKTEDPFQRADAGFVGKVVSTPERRAGTTLERLARRATPRVPAQPAREEIIAAARDVIQKARYCSLMTVGDDGQPQARIVDPLGPDPDFTMWIATNPLTRKVREVRRNPRTTLLCFDTATSSYVTIVGRASLITDPAGKQKHWKTDWAPIYPKGPRDAGFMLIRVTPTRLEIVSESRGMVGDPTTWLPLAIEFPNRRR